MFCPKCGGQNPETGKFCRSCGTDLGVVSNALNSPGSVDVVTGEKAKAPSWEGAISKFATGFAFLVIAIVLATTNMAGGRVWWFWMLIPAFVMIGSGIAQYVQLRKSEQNRSTSGTISNPQLRPSYPANELPPQPAAVFAAESRYKTGDLVPPSVTDATTRHLEMESEGKTMTLPKQ